VLEYVRAGRGRRLCVECARELAAPKVRNRGRRPKRPNGAGHIHQNKNGLWVFQINVGRHPDGYDVRRAIYARSLPDLLHKVEEERATGWSFMFACRRTPRPAAKKEAS
jgi:hypothetical protein